MEIYSVLIECCRVVATQLKVHDRRKQILQSIIIINCNHFIHYYSVSWAIDEPMTQQNLYMILYHFTNVRTLFVFDRLFVFDQRKSTAGRG